MNHPMDSTSGTLEYSTRRQRWPWKPYILGVLTTPTVYLLLYVVLRITGVFYAYYSQGSWEIASRDGGYYFVVSFFPLTCLEGDLHNWLRVLPEPNGG